MTISVLLRSVAAAGLLGSAWLSVGPARADNRACPDSNAQGFTIVNGSGAAPSSGEQTSASIISLGAPEAPQTEKQDCAQAAVEPAPMPNRKVRVVGPAFFPDREEALDLRAQGRTDAR